MAGLRDAAQILEKTVELNQKILTVQTALADAQAEQATLIQVIRNLEEDVARLKAWEAEKQRYELTDISGGNGSIAYVIKDSVKGAEPLHYICANCYEHNKKSILQRVGIMVPEANQMLCPGCKTIFLVWGWPPPRVPSA